MTLPQGKVMFPNNVRANSAAQAVAGSSDKGTT
jgi:hypothetical protein